MPAFQPSKFQSDIYNFIENGTGNAVIDAVAGSGKTTTIVEALKLIPANKSIIFVAFNKSVVKELTERVPSYVEVKTMHAVGFSIVRANMGNVIVKDTKIIEIIDHLYDSWKIEDYAIDGYKKRVRQIVDFARLNLCKNIGDLNVVIEHYGVDIMADEIEKAWLVYNLALNFKQSIDMTDMIFLPAHHNMKSKKYDWVFVDECQDLNRCQHEILKNLIKPETGRFVAVGDPRQAIYGFAGADVMSFKALTEIPNTISLPLSVNYRCPKSVIGMAQKIVPQIEYHANAILGNVEIQAAWENIEPGDFVLCRNVRPLVKLCIDLLIMGKKASVRGKDIGANLIDMLHRTHKLNINDAIDAMQLDTARIINKEKAKGKNLVEVAESAAYNAILDKIQAIEAISTGLITVSDVIKKIQEIFTEDKAGIILSTIHKAKGLEADHVHILNSELMPCKWAKQDWEREQEANLQYVAYTRAKKTLNFLCDYDGTSTITYSLRTVTKQTPELCMNSVKKDGWQLQYVINQTPEICLEAIKNTPKVIEFVNIIHPDLFKEWMTTKMPFDEFKLIHRGKIQGNKFGF